MKCPIHFLYHPRSVSFKAYSIQSLSIQFSSHFEMFHTKSIPFKACSIQDLSHSILVPFWPVLFRACPIQDLFHSNPVSFKTSPIQLSSHFDLFHSKPVQFETCPIPFSSHFDLFHSKPVQFRTCPIQFSSHLRPVSFKAYPIQDMSLSEQSPTQDRLVTHRLSARCFFFPLKSKYSQARDNFSGKPLRLKPVRTTKSEVRSIELYFPLPKKLQGWQNFFFVGPQAPPVRRWPAIDGDAAPLSKPTSYSFSTRKTIQSRLSAISRLALIRPMSL